MKHCPSCNRTYGDDSRMFREVMLTNSSAFPVCPRAESVVLESQRKDNRPLISIAALLLLIVGMTVTASWRLRPNEDLRLGSTAASQLTVTIPSAAHSKELSGNTSPPASTSTQQQQSIAIGSQSATGTEDNDDLPVRFSLDHRDNAARLEFQGAEPLDVGEGSVTRVYVKTGERWDGRTMLMAVKALVTYSIAPVRPGDPNTRTSEEEIRVKSTVRGTITKIIVHEGQKIHHDYLLATIRKD